jgi:hypothetical protein
MHLELPERLLVTRDVLTRSLPTHPLEKAPAMPAGLVADLSGRFAPQAALRHESARLSWFDKVRGFLASPGFGAVAAAVVVLGVAIPMFSAGDRGTQETFRGGETMVAPGEQLRIFFVGENGAARSAVESSGTFEASALTEAENAAAAMSAKGPKVIVDFSAGHVMAFDAQGVEVSRSTLPVEAKQVPGMIAKAVSTL